MTVNWTGLWNALQLDYLRLQDEMSALDTVLTRRDASSWERAGALKDAASSLCRFLGSCRELGLFEDIALAADDISWQKDELLRTLATVLRQEEAVLTEAGFGQQSAGAMMRDLESFMADKWQAEPLAKAVWLKHVDGAIGEACNFPKSEILVLAEDFGKWVSSASKKFKVASGIMIAGANAVYAAHIPEPFTATQFSKLIGFLFIGASIGGNSSS